MKKLVDLELTCCLKLRNIQVSFTYSVKMSVAVVSLNGNAIHDLFSYRVEEPYGLVELQKNEWDPVLHWIENR